MDWSDLEEEVREKVRIGGPDECWEWLGSRLREGYGAIGKKKIRAHRYVFERLIGPIPPGLRLSVCHRCDNPPCVNPAHLFLGTNGTNTRDACRKGRNAVGTAQPGAKLRELQVAVIRQIYAEMPTTQWHLARMYGVSQVLMSSILGRKSWKHVPVLERS